MTLYTLADQVGISHREARRIASGLRSSLQHAHKAAALSGYEVAELRRQFVAAKPPKPPALLPGALQAEFPGLRYPSESVPGVPNAGALVVRPEIQGAYMTVKEVAEALGVASVTINQNVARLFPGLAQNGVTTYLDEIQVTAIKQAIERSGRNDLMNVHKVRNATTELEIVEMTAKVIDYWQGRAKALEGELAVKTEALALAAPKVECYDRFLDASGTMCISDAAKALGLKPSELFLSLDDRAILFRRSGEWIPYQEYIDRGWFEVKTRIFGEPPNEHITRQARITAKGIAALAKMFRVAVTA